MRILRLASKRALPTLGVFATALCLLAPDVGTRILATNDEARFPLLAQDILIRGDWLHPAVNGTPYYNKPPLQAWLIALASWPSGHVTQLTAVLPSALCAVAATLVVWTLGRSLFGTDAARAAALAFITMQGVFLHAHLPLPDILLTALIAASLWAYTIALRRAGWRWWAFYGLVGAAFWAKGPAGLIPLAAALVDGILRFKQAWWRQLKIAPGAVIVLMVVAPWYLVGFFSDRTALSTAIVSDQLQWYAPAAPTVASLVAPLHNLANVLFPWVLLLPLVTAQALRGARGCGTERDHVVFLLVWILTTVALVAVSREQRMRYYVPVAPPVALLIGWWYAGAVVRHRSQPRIRWWVYATLATVVLAIPVAVAASRPRWRADLRLLVPSSALETAVLVLAGLLFIGGIVLGVRLRRLAPGFAVAWTGAALLLVAGYHAGVIRRNAAYDYPQIYAATRPLLHDALELRAWGVPALPLALYFDRPVTLVEADQRLPPTPADRATVVVARTSLLTDSRATGLTVIGRGRLGPDAVVIVSQDAPIGLEPGEL